SGFRFILLKCVVIRWICSFFCFCFFCSTWCLVRFLRNRSIQLIQLTFRKIPSANTKGDCECNGESADPEQECNIHDCGCELQLVQCHEDSQDVENVFYYFSCQHTSG